MNPEPNTQPEAEGEMNNKAQQRLDRSIREAVDATKEIAATPRSIEKQQAASNIAERITKIERKAGKRKGWKLYLDPETGATVYGPKE